MISVGIDVSKGKSTVCVMKLGGEVLKSPFEILHTMEGVLSLVIQKISASKTNITVRIAFDFISTNKKNVGKNDRR